MTVRGIAMLMLLTALSARPVHAQGIAGDETDLAGKFEALTRQVEFQRQAIEAQKQELEQLRARVASDASAGRTLDQRERELVAAMIKEELARSDALKSRIPAWLDGLKFYGDLRMRYEGQWSDGTTRGKDSPWDRNRGRFRLRFGFTRQIGEQWQVGFRLASGADDDPASTNQTFTNDFSEKPIGIDLAYVEYKPNLMKNLLLTAGKMKNPLVTSDLVWDGDVNPEGVAEHYVFKQCGETFQPFATLGQFFLQENSNDQDVSLLAFQVGYRCNLSKDVAWTLASAYYHYINADKDPQLAKHGSAGGNSTWTDGGTKQLDGRFLLVDLYTDLTAKNAFRTMPAKVFAHVVWNADDRGEEPYGSEDFGLAVGAALGQIKKKGDWELSYVFKRIEANAVVAGLTDSDFGGTDRMGHVLGFRYALHDNVSLGTKAFFVDRMLNPSHDPSRVMLQADLEIKF